MGLQCRLNNRLIRNILVAAVGFEPTPPRRLVQVSFFSDGPIERNSSSSSQKIVFRYVAPASTKGEVS